MMKSAIANKVIKALAAINEVFSDTSAPQERTLDALQDIEAELEMKIEALKSDIRRKGQ